VAAKCYCQTTCTFTLRIIRSSNNILPNFPATCYNTYQLLLCFYVNLNTMLFVFGKDYSVILCI